MRLKMALATIAFVIWTQVAIGGMEITNPILEGALAILVFLAILYLWHITQSKWVHYATLIILYAVKHLTGSHAYFFFFLTSLLIFIHYITDECSDSNWTP